MTFITPQGVPQKQGPIFDRPLAADLAGAGWIVAMNATGALAVTSTSTAADAPLGVTLEGGLAGQLVPVYVDSAELKVRLKAGETPAVGDYLMPDAGEAIVATAADVSYYRVTRLYGESHVTALQLPRPVTVP